MNIEITREQRIAFRDWLRAKLREIDPPFYVERGDIYLVRDFMRYCAEKGAEIDEASLGRYINRENPVIPTPARCRALATVFNMRAVDVMKAAGLVYDGDWDEPGDTQQQGEE